MYRHIHILVAEDNENDAFFLKRAFLRAGINAPVHIVTDGENTMSYLSGNGRFADRKSFPMPMLLLLDLKMPGLDGFDVLKWLRQQPGLRRLPVIIFSSSDDPADVNRAHELGANGYTIKATGMDLLLEKLRGIEGYWLKQHLYPEVPPFRTG